MMVLGIDPGMTTGWVLYDACNKWVRQAGQFRGHDLDIQQAVLWAAAANVIERPVANGATRPQVVECAFVAGHLCGQIGATDQVHELTRREVCKILTDLCSLPTEDRVRNDATAWAALKLLHGDGCDRKPRVRQGKVVEAAGCIGTVTSHERAALAVAVAWHARQKEEAAKG